MNSGTRFSRLFKVAFLSAVVLAIHGTWQGHAIAGAIISTPNGLQGGDQFRIIFVTPVTINSTSSSISDYNTFVNNQAAGATYNGTLIHWSALVSTDAVSARDNAGMTSSAVYLANGTEVATSADINGPNGLWSGNSLLAQPVKDITGNSYSGPVWTGSSGVGTEYVTMPTPDGSGTKVTATWGAGNTTDVTVGGVHYVNQVEVGTLNASGTGYAWISASSLATNSNSYQIYGISDVLTVVPEPSSFLISGLGILMVGLTRKNRKRN